MHDLTHNPKYKAKKKESLLNKNKFGASSFNKVYGRYSRQAKNRDLSFMLSKEEFRSIITNNCHYCDSQDTTTEKPFSEEYGAFTYTGIDRKDNKIGYELGNCTKIRLTLFDSPHQSASG